MPELSIHNILNLSNNLQEHFLPSRKEIVPPASTQNIPIQNTSVSKQDFHNLGISMSRFNSSTKFNNNNENHNMSNNINNNTNTNTGGSIINANPTAYAQLHQKRFASINSLDQINIKRRIAKPDNVNSSSLINQIQNDQIISNSLINSRTTTIVNSNDTPPPSSICQSVKHNTNKKIFNITPQASYIVLESNKSQFGMIVNPDQVSTISKVNNSSSEVSPIRNKVQTRSPLDNTRFLNTSPTILPEHLSDNSLQLITPQGQPTDLDQNSIMNNENINNETDIPVLKATTSFQNETNIQPNSTTLSNNNPQNTSNPNQVNNDNINNDNSNNIDNDSNNENPSENSNSNTEYYNNNDDNNSNRKNNRSPDNSNSKKSGQALVQKLQDIYKLIVKQEIELQDRCAQLTTSQTTELKNLWTIYRINVDLINNYTTFITTALLPSQSQQDILIGEEIIEIYRIERRLWVYGTITFLDVLKNFSNFMDPDVCSQFITHVFISLSTMLIDIPPKHSIPWLQRLGDLSRMAIALYPSGFIDWKLSAEYWYLEAMKFTYSHGKLYYHMSTVQQNTLEAFVNLGKSVFCQDTFTPSQQYMQLVIDNIYQRTFVDRTNNGNIRNSDLIDYLKHSEVMLLPSFLENNELQKVVLNYFQDRFGLDYNDNNIFLTQQMFSQIPSSIRFFFRHAPAFAESHILQLVGFGNPKNPFALLFDLPKFLKERKNKKDKNRTKSNDPAANVSVSNSVSNLMSVPTTTANSPSSSTQSLTDFNSSIDIDSDSLQISTYEFFENIDSLKLPIKKADLYIWIKSLEYINLTSLKCSMIVLKKFLQGPFLIALPHLLPWTYFIIATSIKSERDFHDNPNSLRFWRILLKRIIPWNSITNFLNVLLAYLIDNFDQSKLINELCKEYSQFENFEKLLQHLNENEELPEIWKCWGTLWYDVISDKSALKADNYKDLGIKDHMFLDLPIDGIDFDVDDETGDKFWKRAIRLIFLFKGIAENFDIGLKVNYDVSVYCNNESVEPNHFLRSFAFKMELYNEQISPKFNELIPLCEDISEINSNFEAMPALSVVEGESIFDYIGYKKFYPNSQSFDKNGDLVSASLYTTYLNGSNNSSTTTNHTSGSSGGGSNPDVLNNNANNNTNMLNSMVNSNDIFSEEEEWFTKYMGRHDSLDYNVRRNDEIDKDITYFVFDATSWLRHFAHIYKLATNSVLKFAVCLTTFQELRFLRKSKDENVVEAAARAIITMRQLYREGKLLPLRFTGNIAADIEEHLEVEEQITWRSHVDEFVIEAVMKAQYKFKENNVGMSLQFNYVVLVTDDATMAKKAKDQGIMTFSTHFIFSLCTKMSNIENVCTN